MISLILYKHNKKFDLVALKEIILSNTGNKYRIKGYKRPKIKLIIESFIKAIWEFTYTPQKQAIAYQ